MGRTKRSTARIGKETRAKGKSVAPESVKENGGRGTKKTARAQMWCLGEHDDNNAYDRNEKNVGMQGELR